MEFGENFFQTIFLKETLSRAKKLREMINFQLIMPVVISRRRQLITSNYYKN